VVCGHFFKILLTLLVIIAFLFFSCFFRRKIFPKSFAEFDGVHALTKNNRSEVGVDSLCSAWKRQTPGLPDGIFTDQKF
jgi:hypothetical protein